MLRVKSKICADTITSIEQQFMFQWLKKGMILLKNPSIEPIRHSEQSEESHVFPDLRPFTEFILRERRVQGDNQRPFLSRIYVFKLTLLSLLRGPQAYP